MTPRHRLVRRPPIDRTVTSEESCCESYLRLPSWRRWPLEIGAVLTIQENDSFRGGERACLPVLTQLNEPLFYRLQPCAGEEEDGQEEDGQEEDGEEEDGQVMRVHT